MIALEMPMMIKDDEMTWRLDAGTDVKSPIFQELCRQIAFAGYTGMDVSDDDFKAVTEFLVALFGEGHKLGISPVNGNYFMMHIFHDNQENHDKFTALYKKITQKQSELITMYNYQTKNVVGLVHHKVNCPCSIHQEMEKVQNFTPGMSMQA